MNDRDALRLELQNPATAPARLSEIAAAAPDLGAEVAAHPAAFPELLDWLSQYGDARAQAAVAAVRGGGVPAAPAAPQATEQPFAAAAPAADPGYPAAAAASASPFDTAAQPFGTAAQPFGTAAPGAVRTKKSRVPLFVALGVVGALVVGGGVTAAIFLPRLLPATSPEGAAEKLLASSLSLDPLGLAGSLAPSEIASLQGAVEKLSDIQVDDDESTTAKQALDRLKNALTVTTKDLEYSTDELTDDVTRVTVEDGKLIIDGDEEEVADAIVELSRQVTEEQLDSYGYSKSEIADSLEESKQSIEDSLDLPYTVDFGELNDETPGIVSVVTVHEGAGWYVSPLLTAADLAYQAQWRWTDDKPRLGRSIPDAVTAADAGEAAEQTLRAALDTEAGDDYWQNLAATLPLAERRVVALYGPGLGADDPWQYYGENGERLDLEDASFTTTSPGHAVPDKVGVSWQYSDGNAGGSLSFTGTCAEWDSWYTDYDWYYDENQTYDNPGDGCLEDLPVELGKLGLDEPTLTAVQSDGGWQFSVLATVGDWASSAADGLVKLSKDGELDSLVRAADR